MVTKRDENRQPTDNRQGEYRAICLGKVRRQSFAKTADLVEGGTPYLSYEKFQDKVQRAFFGTFPIREALDDFDDRDVYETGKPLFIFAGFSIGIVSNSFAVLLFTWNFTIVTLQKVLFSNIVTFAFNQIL